MREPDDRCAASSAIGPWRRVSRVTLREALSLSVAMIHLNEKFELPASQQQVWELLQDVPLVIACIPGASANEKLEDGAYRGGIGVQYRDIGVRFDGTIRVTPEPIDGMRILAEGSAGRQVKVMATIDLRLYASASSSTMDVAVDLDFAGPFAPFASSATRVVGPSLFRSFGACLASKAAALR